MHALVYQGSKPVLIDEMIDRLAAGRLRRREQLSQVALLAVVQLHIINTHDSILHHGAARCRRGGRNGLDSGQPRVCPPRAPRASEGAHGSAPDGRRRRGGRRPQPVFANLDSGTSIASRPTAPTPIPPPRHPHTLADASTDRRRSKGPPRRCFSQPGSPRRTLTNRR